MHPLGNTFSRICGRTSVLTQIARMVRSYAVTAENGQHMKMMLIAPRWQVVSMFVPNPLIMLNLRQELDVDVSKKPVITDGREQCPICLIDVADLTGRSILTKHLASHLERFSLDCLPLDTSSCGNENVQDEESTSSDPDEDIPSEHYEHNAHNEQETNVQSFEVQTEEDSRGEKIVLSEEYPQELELEQEILQAGSELLGESPERGQRRTQEAAGTDDRLNSGERDWKKFDEVTKPVIENYEHEPREAGEEARPDELGYGGTRESYRREAEEDWLPALEKRAREHGLSEEIIQVSRLQRFDIDAEKRRTIDRHREMKQGLEREIEQQGDRAAVELLKSRGRVGNEENEDKGQRTEQDERCGRVRKGLAEAEFPQSEIDAIMVSDRGRKQQPASTTPKAAPSPAGPWNPHVPVYAKVHTEHMAIETLKYYDIPREYDRVSQTRSLFVVIRLTFCHSPIPPTSSSSVNWTNMRPTFFSILHKISRRKVRAQ